MRLFPALLSVAAALLLSSCGTQSPTGQDIDKAFRPLIPPETKFLGAIDIARLKQSALYAARRQDIDRLYERIGADRFGIDPRRDLDYLGFFSDGRRAVIFAKGNFRNANKRELSKAGSPIEFLNDRVALAGDREAIRAARGLEAKGSGEVPEELAARLHSLPKNDALWLVGRGPLPVDNIPLANDTRSNLGNFVGLVNGITAGLALDNGLLLTGRLSTQSPAGATRIHDALRGIVALGRLSVKDNETDLLRIYDAIQIGTNGNIVEVNASLPEADVNRLLERMPRSY